MPRPQLDRLLKEEAQIYVRNQTKPRGRVVITFYDSASRKAIPVQIPRTLLPICVSDHVSIEVIKSSSDFRRYIMKGILELMDPDKAKKELSTDDAKEELADINESRHTEVRQARQIQTRQTNINVPEEDDTELETVPITPRVLSIVAGISEGSLNVRPALRDLKPMADQLTDEDLSYILSNVSRGKIHSFASAELASRQKIDEPDDDEDDEDLDIDMDDD